MSDPLRAAVFDLDGTLADSAPDIAAALNDTLAAGGLATFDLATVKTMVGGGADLLIQRAMMAAGGAPDAALAAVLLEDFLSRYRRTPCAATRLYPGALALLDALRGAGAACGICTNKPADLTELVLRGLGVRDCFSSVVAATDALPPKPAPDMLNAVLAELGVRPEQAVMVGDSAADSGVARAAGVRCILVRHGYSRDPVDGLGADIVVDSFEALARHLVRVSA
ncbi:MAG: phosphoglycolate phosphatase [Hyphomicrobium sp.]